MKVTEFSDKTKVDNVRPEWEKYLGKDDFISYKPSYIGGTERDKFDKFTFPAEKTGDITYYLYDPIKNGAVRESGKYPLLIFTTVQQTHLTEEYVYHTAEVKCLQLPIISRK